MPSVSLSVPNPLGQEAAAERLKSFLAKLKEHHQDKVSDLTEEWPNPHHLKYSFKTFGFSIQGEAQIEPESVHLHLNLPFAAMMFKSKIEQTVKDEIARVLGPPKS